MRIFFHSDDVTAVIFEKIDSHRPWRGKVMISDRCVLCHEGQNFKEVLTFIVGTLTDIAMDEWVDSLCEF